MQQFFDLFFLVILKLKSVNPVYWWHNVDELMVVHIYDHEARLNSYGILMELQSAAKKASDLN
jgi:hypothetical protein